MVQFVNTQQSVVIKIFRHLHKGQRAQVVVNEWNIRRQPRNPFIDILKRLKVRQVYDAKKCLFEWIGYGNSSIQYLTPLVPLDSAVASLLVPMVLYR